MNLIDQQNQRLLLCWLNKFRGGYKGVPMWPDMAQEWFDRDLRRKRARAMDYMVLRRLK